MGSGPPAASALTGKRTLALSPVSEVSIEMPDGSIHDFGPDFAASLTTQLTQSGRYIVLNPPAAQTGGAGIAGVEMRSQSTPDYEWSGDFVPAATVSLAVEAMDFQTGSGGEHIFYGFNENFRTPFNDGSGALKNEYPLRPGAAEPSWFGTSFDDRGTAPFDSRSGLDLGDGFDINVLFAWLSVKYANYHSDLRLRMTIDAPLAGVHQFREVDVAGGGFFFDVAGAYAGYSAGIALARTDAMGQALQAAIAGTFGAVDRAVGPLPMAAKVDAIVPDGSVLLGTGANAAVVPGTIFEAVANPALRLSAVQSNSSGTIARVASGGLSNFQPGTLLREVQPGAPALGARVLAAASASTDGSVPAAVDSTTLPSSNLPEADLSGESPVVSWFDAFLMSLADTVTLPYRIWRYAQYDQAYDAEGADPSNGAAWVAQARAEPWARQIGLSRVTPAVAPGVVSGPIVAVIDSGVDYNHWALQNNIWVNPAPGPRGDLYGWDFVSDDERPYDDGYHGTEVASLVVAEAPGARIMPLKVFNPWGITTSAAIYGAFVYAVDHGASVIACGWATPLKSQALEQGVAYARAHGVAVVAAAGDFGNPFWFMKIYPAALSASYDNVLTVTNVDGSDALVGGAVPAGFDPTMVGLAAPGTNVLVATPRGETTRDTSTSLSAALAAGALARLIGQDAALAANAPSAWIQALRARAQAVPALSGAVSGGLRLRIF